MNPELRPGKASPFKRTSRRHVVRYPRLPTILDDESLGVISTLESKEMTFARATGSPRHQYLRALYLKATAHLGHSHFQPKDIPRQLRYRIAELFGSPQELVRILAIDRAEKSRIVSAVRLYLGLSIVTAAEVRSARQWLQADIARRESDVAVLVNATIEHFRERRCEIPPQAELFTIVKQAAQQITTSAIQALDKALGAARGEHLESILAGEDGKTTFDLLKHPAPAASPLALEKELQKIELIRSFLTEKAWRGLITRHQLEQFADQARRYTAPELKQLAPPRRRTLLACFLTQQHAFLLDTAAEMLMRVWDNTRHHANDHANAVQEAMADSIERRQRILSELLDIIVHKGHDALQLFQAIQQHRTRHEYLAIIEELKISESRNTTYLGKIEDHYPALRRFLPDWYRLIPLSSTTTEDSILRAQAFVHEHASAESSELPAEGCPTGFLPAAWEKKAIRYYVRDGKILRVFKMPYELGLLEATAQGLKNGTVAITDANRYAPMLDHLLPRKEFLSRYQEYVGRMGHPLTAKEYYTPLRKQLRDDLDRFDKEYQSRSKEFWVNKDGTLGLSRLPGQRLSTRLMRLRDELSRRMPVVSIIDLLLDCHRWTGFLDTFQPTAGRQNMSSNERLRHALGALYGYGCNCGPAQAARALQLQKNQVVYMRRRYMPTQNLMEAASRLAQAFQETPHAVRLGDLGVLLTDSTQVRTLKESLIARQHHRYKGGKSTLLYQHVGINCICLFTQALLCNVSEAIHMLSGALELNAGKHPLINICDSAGKSNRVFGLSSLLKIMLYPRVRSGHLMLFSADDGAVYKNIASAITAPINFDLLDRFWQDMMWILASIHAGTAKPLTILERLNHPAGLGFDELGKLERTLYLLRYGMDLDLRRFVVPYTSRREHWNKFTGEVLAFGDLIRDKTLEDQTETFWFLTVVQNAIVLWNALSLENAIRKAREANIIITDEDLKHILPTMTEHIDFVGRFDVDLKRKPLFDYKHLVG